MAPKYLLISAALLASTTSALAQPATTDYVVQPGDSCISIAASQLASGKRYKEIHQLNPNLGPEPHKLVPGTHLLLPKATNAPDANLAQTRGVVQFRKPTTDAWSAALRGMDLFRAWRVGSLDKSSADVKFVDSTAMHMRENTVVIIYGPTVARAKTFAAVAELEKGTLETRLAQLGTKSAPQRVLTPSSVAALDRGDALIVVDDAGTSWIGNHAGNAIAVQAVTKKQPRGSAVKVTSGMGSKVDKGKLPGKPRPLPPSPVLANSPTIFVSSDGAKGKIAMRWTPSTAKIVRYRAVLRDDKQQDLMTTEIAGSATAVEFVDVPVGTYSVDVAAIDDEGFESIRVASLPLTLTQLAFLPAGGTATDALPTVIALGSQVKAPPRVRCAFGDDTVDEVAVARVVGATDLRCESAISSQGPDVATGEEIFRSQVEVAPISVTTQTLPTLERNVPTNIVVAVASRGPLATDQVTLLPSAGIATKLIKIEDGFATVEVTVAEDLPAEQTSVELQLALGGAALDPVQLPIEPLVVAAAPAPRPRRQHDRLELGGFVGGMFVNSASELGDAPTRAGAVDSGTALGARVAGILHPRFFVEGELSLAPTGYIAQTGAATVITARAHLAASALRNQRYQLRVLGGLGAASLLGALGEAQDDTDIALHGGAALVVRASQDMWFRAQVLDQVFAAPDGGYAHVPEVTVGLSTRVGW
ncbi:MAG TPA: LysM domain-containing protein [Kofleriaceae bacterium]|nr:LysM domain-containing protein [Kofleriaceae bacterium]